MSLVCPKLKIIPHKKVLPEVVLEYFSLFENPKSSPDNYELSIDGQDVTRTTRVMGRRHWEIKIMYSEMLQFLLKI